MGYCIVLTYRMVRNADADQLYSPAHGPASRFDTYNVFSACGLELKQRVRSLYLRLASAVLVAGLQFPGADPLRLLVAHTVLNPGNSQSTVVVSLHGNIHSRPRTR